MAIVIGNHLKPILSSRCFHIKGHGGAKKAVREVHNHLSPKSYVMKSDVKSYYASIDHMLLFDMLTGYVNDKYVLRLLWQYLNRTVCYGENYQEISRGISLGCPLSPLMAALFLKPLDDAMQDSGLFYVRFMDDWIVIAPTRWKLRKAVAKVNTILEGLLLEKHPDKTFIGRAVRGFSFLGYFLTPWGVSVAQSTWKNMQKRISRLYEQDAGSIGQYVTRWLRWVIAGNIGVDVAVLQGQCAGLVSLVPAFH
ncbi:MAG: reverse transcriptase/maturase family protein [Proteobacteria bacterium]|nr:reverse transcriptase/maturase family protein [Pseudomonadota bacterium]MBU1418357.1 reverse transcriptase/maturase family protein [Pseudomonadota bacterium]